MRLLIFTIGLVAAVWLVPFLVSEESGLKFGWPYSLFFTLIIFFGGSFFYLLRVSAMPALKSARRAFVGVALVFIISTGGIALIANLAPQFVFEASGPAAATSQERGKALFNDPKAACFLCHAVGGSGGTRGPDLSHIALVSGNRRPGMSSEAYLRQSLLEPGAFVVPSYDNIMPPIAQGLSSEELSDLLTYLTSLE